MPLKRKTRKANKIPLPGPNQCHPRVGATPNGGCLPLNILQDACRRLRIEPDGSSPLQRDELLTGGAEQKTLLQKRLAKHLGVNTNNQRTLLQRLPLEEAEKEALAKQWLRPAMPEAWKSDPDMWLDSNNILSVMKQYEEAHPEFKFLGPYPIDFAGAKDSSATSPGKSKECLIEEMCDLDLSEEALEGKTKIGIIYNLDPHYKGGSHWVANFINIPKKTCYYFDSYGMKPPRPVYKFMQWLSLQEPTIQLGWNGRRFQRLDSECGMYCMYFLDRMIAGEPFLKFCRRAPSDAVMLDLRDWMFST